ncbi:uncharacterized protein [Spinacia oleracea]|uniref:Uncharacterized protein isoform X1 n=1 Tax=Spinacia oleracea TaxID=3562 RepID=A0ABM3R278_SPIOL|nr:uncharacterized protein LOC130464277 isoform X1 [Spinacia oleracea]
MFYFGFSAIQTPLPFSPPSSFLFFLYYSGGGRNQAVASITNYDGSTKFRCCSSINYFLPSLGFNCSDAIANSTVVSLSKLSIGSIGVLGDLLSIEPKFLRIDGDGTEVWPQLVVPGMNVNSFVRTFSVVATMDYPPVYMVQRRVTDYLCSVITEYANWLRIPPLRVTIRHNMIVREGTETIQDVGIVNGSTLYAIIE